MTGGTFYAPPGEEYELELGGQNGDAHSVQWVGTPGVKGPPWARLPLLTVGVLGTQVVWSIEMGYASPFLLELGLSKSWMSLVFMAGPLSGLIVQPLIGAYADRSRSRFGRRRPFMLTGTGVAVIAMMLLGYAREISSLLGMGQWGAIACAVLAIYLIDFSINAVMSTDRALIVDTLPPSQQEAANAWAGRMGGIGGVAGFFVGNVDVTKVLSWLGKTQLQILSFLTSMVLALAHTSTSWAVTERVLLRDDRAQSRSGLFHSLRAIWENIFTLPPSIRTICYIQFFANLGWYPILFFTSVWVSEIYKRQTPQGTQDEKAWQADAVRAGSRALFLQSIISLTVSICAPFMVAESGVQSGSQTYGYASLREGDQDEPPTSATWKHAEETAQQGTLLERTSARLGSLIKYVKSGRILDLPIRGLTLIRLWTVAQVIFVLCMLASWFAHTVAIAYAIVAVTGFSWSLAQWAPYALIGELVLIDCGRPQSVPISRRESDEIVFEADEASTQGHSRRPSHETLEASPGRPDLSLAISDDGPPMEMDSIVIRHSDESVDQPTSPAPVTPVIAPTSTADKAGLILGIHNVFIVLPQFVITGVSSLIFYLMEAETPHPVHAAPGVPVVHNGTITEVMRAAPPHTANERGSPDAVGLVFRIGGVCAAGGAFLSYRLGKRWLRGEV